MIPAAVDLGDPRWAATAPEPVDTGHRLTGAVWAAIVADATLRRSRRTTGRVGLPDRTITARSHGGIMPGGPRLGVIHTAETPLARGYAYSIAANWFATKATTSAHVMIDPGETIRLLPDNVVAYAVGPAANGFTLNVEQAGRASLPRATWLSDDGRVQMGNVAEFVAEARDLWGIPTRWATDAEIRRARADPSFRAGWCRHDDIRRVLGGTVHTDPGPGYPGAELMTLAAAGGDDMPTADDIVTAMLNRAIPRQGGQAGAVSLGTFLAWSDANNLATGKRAADEVLGRGIKRQGPGASGTTTLEQTVAWLDSNLGRLLAGQDPAALASRLAPLIAAQLPPNRAVGQADIHAAVRSALEEAAGPPPATPRESPPPEPLPDAAVLRLIDGEWVTVR